MIHDPKPIETQRFNILPMGTQVLPRSKLRGTNTDLDCRLILGLAYVCCTHDYIHSSGDQVKLSRRPTVTNGYAVESNKLIAYTITTQDEKTTCIKRLAKKALDRR
jgi:hypothetical protein